MFGLTWGQIGIIVIVATFVLGPERIPTAVKFALDATRKARRLAAGTQASLLRDIGPEIDELRRQIADLQSALTASGTDTSPGTLAMAPKAAMSLQSTE